MKNFYVCKRLKLLSWLNAAGFLPFKQVPDNNNDKYTCWLFINSEALQQSINEYYAQPTHKK